MFYKCVVCISTFCSEEVICSLQCGHVFHQNCLQQLNTFPSAKCPLCRCDSTIGIRRLYFSITPDTSHPAIDVDLIDDLQDEVRQKSQIIGNLEEEIATMKLDNLKRDKEMNALKAKLKKVENTNTTLKRDLKIAKGKENESQKENKKLCVENSQLLKKMEENLDSKKSKRNDNILRHQSASKGKVEVMQLTPQMKRKTATSRKALSLFPSSTTSSANLNSNQFSTKPRLVKQRVGVNVVEETPSPGAEQSTQKAPIKRRAMPSSQALFHQTMDNETVKQTRGRMINGKFRPLRNL